MQRFFCSCVICCSIFLIIACQSTSEQLSNTPFQVVSESQQVPPTLMVTAVPSSTFPPTPTLSSTKTPTTVPSPKPTLMPTPTPIFDPFEATLRPEPVAYPLPLAREGDIAIYFQNSRMIVANIADAQLTDDLWESESFGEMISAVTDEDYLHIWSEDTLMVWNIGDIRNPIRMSSLPLGIDFQVSRAEISVDDNRLYFLQAIRHEATLTTIDVTVPESPIVLGTAEFYLPVFHPYLISKNHLFVVDEGAIDVFDLFNPIQPNLVAQISVSTNINSSLWIRDHLLFVTTSSTLFVFDISDLVRPVLLAEYNNTQINQLVILDGTALLYLEICGWEPRDDGTVSGGCSYLLDVVDIEIPAQPQLRGTFTLRFDTNQEMVNRIHLHDPYLYFEMLDGRLFMLELNQAEFARDNK